MSTSPYGFTVFSSTAGVIGKLPQILADMQLQGSTDLRLQIPEYLIDTTGDLNPAHFTWTGLDDAVLKCNAAGINVVFSIMYMYAGGVNPQGLFPITSPVGYYTYAITSGGVTQYVPDPTKMATFATLVAQRYNGGAHGLVYAVEPGNEEYCLASNTNSVRDAGGTPAALALAGCYSSIKTANPAILVPAASLLRQDLTGIQTWITGFFQAGGFACCDALEFHLYKNSGTPPTGNGGPENGTVGFSAFWRQMRDVMASLGVLKPIWCTEAGYGTDNVDVTHQWQYMVQELDSCSNSGGAVTKYYWYTIGNNDVKSQTQHGQVDGLTETYQPCFWVMADYIHRKSQWYTPLPKQTTLTAYSQSTTLTAFSQVATLTES